MDNLKVTYEQEFESVVEYHENGNVWYTGQFLNDEAHGLWEIYHYNGNLWYKGYFNHGQEIGLWEWYDEDGENLIQELYV